MRLYAKINLPNINSFIADFGALFVKAQEQHGLPALALCAQAALETQWGTYILRVQDSNRKMVDTKNLFNIKASNDWAGNVGQRIVREVYDGKEIMSNEWFKVYENYTESVDDYCSLIMSYSRYQKAWQNRNDPFRYAEEVAVGGYATDPEYLKIWKSIMHNSIGVTDDNKT